MFINLIRAARGAMPTKLITPLLVILLLTLFTACAGGSADSLAGTSWQLAEMGGAAPLTGSTITLIFEEGSAGGSAGCNSFGGSYTVEGDTISFKDLASTLMACMEPGLMEQESAYLAILGGVTSYELKAGDLFLYRADGSALRFIPLK